MAKHEFSVAPRRSGRPNVALSRRKQGFESPRERNDFSNLAPKGGPRAGISNFSPMDGASDDRFEVTL